MLVSLGPWFQLGGGVTLPPSPAPGDIWQGPEMFGFAVCGRGCCWLFTGWGQGRCLRRLPAAKSHPAPNVSCAEDKKAVPIQKKHTCALFPRVSWLTFLNLESTPQSDHRLVSCQSDKCHSDSPWNFGPEASLPKGGRHPAHPFWESQMGSFVLPLDKAVVCQPPYQIGLLMAREEGGGLRMGNTCIPVADSLWYLAKLIQLCKV